VWLQITGGEPRCNEPLYNEDPGIISHTISRFHADLIVNHNTFYHPITTDTMTQKKKWDSYRNNLLFIWATSLWEGGQVADFCWIIIMRQSTINKKLSRSIGFGNRTKSNVYFAVSSIFEHNRTQSGSILFGIHLLISKSRRTNHNQPLLNGINRTTSKYRTECQCSVIYIL